MYSPFTQDVWTGSFSTVVAVFIVVATLWSLVWKGLALWKSAEQKQLTWFVVLLVVNTMGVLEIVYLLFFRKDRDARSFTSLFGTRRKPNPSETVAE